MPWRNGGGTTTEIYVHPEGSGLDGTPFDWRVSIADVAADGPFSVFAGYDRTIMCIAGEGMILSGGAEGDIDVRARFVPRAFRGEWSIVSRLVAGPIRDFNLMVHRSRGCGRLEVETVASATPLGETHAHLLVHVLDGYCRIGDAALDTHDSALLEPGESAVLEPLDRPARLALCAVSRRA